MQKNIIAALFVAAAAFPAIAQAGPFYLGGEAIYAEQKIGQDDGSIKKSKTGGGIYGGFDFNKNFGLQLGFIQFGEAKFDTTAQGVKIGFKPRTVYLVGTATGAVDEQFSVFVKAGAATTRTKETVSYLGDSESGSETHSTGVIGVGGKFVITPKLSAVLEYTHFGKVLDEDDGNLKVTGYSIGLRYNF